MSDRGAITAHLFQVLDTHYYLSVYSCIIASVFVSGIIGALFTFHVLVSAARSQHNKMFSRILRCPVLFFDTNPVGE